MARYDAEAEARALVRSTTWELSAAYGDDDE